MPRKVPSSHAQKTDIPAFYHDTAAILGFGRSLESAGFRTETLQSHVRDPGLLIVQTPPPAVKEHYARSAQGGASQRRRDLSDLHVHNQSAESHATRKALLTFGVHARELISSDIAYWLMMMLSGNTEELTEWASFREQTAKLDFAQRPDLKACQASATSRDCISAILNLVQVTILPVVNVNGRRQVEFGNTCMRKTFSGIDLNRNFPVHWRPSLATQEDYSGEFPFSDPLSRGIAHVANEVRPDLFIDFHSGEWAIYTPWDALPAAPTGLPADMPDLLSGMNQFCDCITGAAGQVAGYLANGSILDYMWSGMNVSYPLTVEAFGPGDIGKLRGGVVAQEAHARTTLDKSDSCFRLFNPATEAEYQRVVSTWLASILHALTHVASSPVLAQLSP